MVFERSSDVINSNGAKFKSLLHPGRALPILGTINAYSALLAEHAGAQAIYLSGAGVANASYGLPDLGMTGLAEVLEDVRRILAVSSLPLLVDIDTGWGHIFSIQRAIKLMENAGVAAIHMEDQVAAKRCGHRPNKLVVPMQEMGDKLKSAVDARQDPNFVIIARTDAVECEGVEKALERAVFYCACGADMIFAEALTTIEDYKYFVEHCKVPILANLTEYGKTPLFTRTELAAVGVQLVLYPLSAFRAMSRAAAIVYQTILAEDTQSSCLKLMQTREELYDILKYYTYEKTIDRVIDHE